MEFTTQSPHDLETQRGCGTPHSLLIGKDISDIQKEISRGMLRSYR
jgi:hypothetical protein